MADTLEIFGVEYTGVTGLVATDDNDTDLTYIRPQGTKSISANGIGIDVAEYASVDVNVSAPSPTLQSKTYTVDSAGTETITADSGYDGLSSVSVSVPSASPFMGASSETFVTEGGQRMWKANVFTEVNVSEGDIEGWLPDGYHQDYSFTKMAVPSNTTITPTTSAQTIGGANYMMEGAVTVAAMPSGTAGTPTATKGTVSNHSVSVTPSVTNTSGYITGSTINGTAVTVSASELVSGSQTVTTNDTYDVTNLAELVVDVSGGSVIWVTEYDGNVTIVTDNPNYAVINNWAPSHPTFADGQTWRVTWKGTEYVCPVKELTYQGTPVSYIGNGQISGATDTSNEPFLAYMRTSTQLAFVTTDAAGTITLKMELQQSSSATLIEKSITANGTYDAEDDDADGYSSVTVNVSSGTPTIQSLTVAPSTTQQSFNASGVDGYKPVTVSAVSQTNLSAENIKSGTTISISSGQSNLWSVTGTYEGGGGSSDVATGTLTVASNVNTSTSTQITTTTAIGFTPTKFFFWKDARAATSNHVNQSTFTTIGSYYIRTMTRYSNNTLSTSGNANNWTTQTAGYLYFNNNTIYFRSSSSYILSSGTWSWVAVK